MDKETITEEIFVKKISRPQHKKPRLENLDKIDQNYEKLEHDFDLDKFDKLSTNFDEYRDRFDRLSPNVDKLSQKLDRLSPGFDKVGQSLDRVGQRLGQNWDKVGHLIEQTFDNGLKLDRITFESEKLRIHSESSSRRNSDDGGKAKAEGFRSGKKKSTFPC